MLFGPKSKGYAMFDQDCYIVSKQELAGSTEKAKTLANAIEWNDETDKFVFCIELLGLSAHENRADRLVNSLENWYYRVSTRH